ncbi:nucleotidyltransferase family protein [Microbacterium oleivorans]|uniref:NTP transferase domain-containing protein n=1 Tax=Microbacterium oleivorans TaxID=273677 RepID=A0A7D5JDD2_9MICO|nr:NTP transferase domain-containing protein [Microbacterium oleivorans]QLD11760.1 NTP transferase domain-containing protein [Microbacterium oleivorans]
MPKALATGADGVPWIDRVVASLAAAGCAPILVMLGAAPDAPVPALARPRTVADWNGGLSSTLRAALLAAGETSAEVAVLVPVDVPDIPPTVLARVLRASGGGSDALARAVYGRRPGHPAVLGRAHWTAAAAAASGDQGAGPYLARSGALQVECADLWHGRDVDRPEPTGVTARRC